MKLREGDQIEVAWAETARGPGWSNQLIWVLVRDRDGRLREEPIQPGKRSSGMDSLHAVCAAAAESLTVEVKRWAAEEGDR